MTHPFLTKQIISGVKSKRTLEKIDLIVRERWAVGLADLQQQIPGVWKITQSLMRSRSQWEIWLKKKLNSISPSCGSQKNLPREQEIKIEVRPSVPPPLPNPGFLFVTLIWLTAEDTCGGTVRGGSGVVTSPGYPGNYGNQADCTWILLAEPGDTISVIFTDFQTEEKYDYLEVEGSEPPTIWWVGLF